jgi:hypothetical protein
LGEKFSFVSRGRLSGRLVWIVYFSLGLCLVYSLFYLASYSGLSFFVLSNRSMVVHSVSGSLVSAPLDLAVWGCAVLVVLAWLIYDLGSGVVGGFYRFFAKLICMQRKGANSSLCQKRKDQTRVQRPGCVANAHASGPGGI